MNEYIEAVAAARARFKERISHSFNQSDRIGDGIREQIEENMFSGSALRSRSERPAASEAATAERRLSLPSILSPLPRLEW